MSTRRSRFSLSLVRRSESPMSPIGDRTRSSTSEHNISASSGCSTPLNTRKRGNSLKSDSPVSYESDHSPIPMSQDERNLVSGVSWAWNSPKRAVADDNRFRPKPLSSKNQISYKDSESSRSYRKRASDKLTGFYRFQSELKRLEERDEPTTSDQFEVKKTLSCSSMQVLPPTSPPPSPDRDNLFLIRNAKQRRESLIVKPKVSSEASDSFNNSDLDNLLLQASQAVEQQFDSTVTLPKRPNLTPNTAQEQQPEKRRSFFKSKTTDNFDSNSDDSFPEAELELLLQHVALPGPTNNQDSTKPPSNGSSRKSGLLTRHKSMPESPRHKMIQEGKINRSSNVKWNTKAGAQSPISIASSSSGSVMFVPNENNVVVIASSSGGSLLASSSTSSSSGPTKKCSKEEIEQKRQEALKRQASRLKRLMQGNHSRSEL